MKTEPKTDEEKKALVDEIAEAACRAYPRSAGPEPLARVRAAAEAVKASEDWLDAYCDAAGAWLEAASRMDEGASQEWADGKGKELLARFDRALPFARKAGAQGDLAVSMLVKWGRLRSGKRT